MTNSTNTSIISNIISNIKAKRFYSLFYRTLGGVRGEGIDKGRGYLFVNWSKCWVMKGNDSFQPCGVENKFPIWDSRNSKMITAQAIKKGSIIVVKDSDNKPSIALLCTGFQVPVEEGDTAGTMAVPTFTMNFAGHTKALQMVREEMSIDDLWADLR